MPVAKSYAGLEILCEPYTLDKGRQYVKVRTKSGASKQVRFYTDKEYAKMYPAEASSTEPATEIIRPLKEVLGFKEGYITIFKGDTYNYLEWFRRSTARFARYWGWYFVSDEPMPAEYPYELEPVHLKWEDVSTPDGNALLPEDQVKAIVDSIIYDPGDGEFVGEVGERLEIYAYLKRVIELENGFGVSWMHIWEDDLGNEYTWTTSSKRLEDDKEYHFRGTIKKHTIYRNHKQNVLTRCTIL
jgi:hypothetical protein